jgi:hypothetical protein
MAMCCVWVNELHLIDISDLENPLIKYSSNDNLWFGSRYKLYEQNTFVCDGDAGLKFLMLQPFKYWANCFDSSINGYDVIAHQDILMMIGKDGLYQYSYQDPQNFKLFEYYSDEIKAECKF